MPHDLPLLTTLAAAFAAAWVLGIITQKLKLSPIVGYLLAGVVIGPHTPGFVGDVHLAQQLAEVGVILLMFGVGLHFHLKDLLAVRKVAVPGAIVQSAATTVVAVAICLALGWPLKAGLVLGLAMSVASTVVLIRVLSDNDALDTPQGHVAVGWLIVEDVLTVIVLVLIPALGVRAAESSLGWALLVASVKLVALVAVLYLAGSKVIPRIMVWVARLRSRELFTLTVLVMSIAVAVAAAQLFGASVALGAFLAGMVVGQSPVSSQAAADALPMRDAFAVLFFASVGMLFDPAFVVHEPVLMIAGLSLVLLVKPAAALGIVLVLGYPLRTALTVAIALAQIGEFSFILSEVGKSAGLLGDAAHHLLVACAIISITLNPLLFRLIGPIEAALQRRPALWRLLDRRARGVEFKLNEHAGEAIARSEKPLAVILGYGPVGRAIDSILRGGGGELETVIVDLNMDTIESLTRQGRSAIYGDAYNVEVMHKALPRATHLIITLPHAENRSELIAAAKLINPAIKVFVRARYVGERDELFQFGADAAAYEEAEVAAALARLVLADRGADDQTIRRETVRIRRDLIRSSSAR
jgi:CPA2 family monovalent cation:H+ antiporter-2